MHTQCQNVRCGAVDSFEHLIKCSGMGDPPAVQPGREAMEEGNEEMLTHLEQLANKAYEINPGPPAPMWPREGDAEIELYSICSEDVELEGEGETDIEMEFENDLSP